MKKSTLSKVIVIGSIVALSLATLMSSLYGAEVKPAVLMEGIQALSKFIVTNDIASLERYARSAPITLRGTLAGAAIQLDALESFTWLLSTGLDLTTIKADLLKKINTIAIEERKKQFKKALIAAELAAAKKAPAKKPVAATAKSSAKTASGLPVALLTLATQTVDAWIASDNHVQVLRAISKESEAVLFKYAAYAARNGAVKTFTGLLAKLTDFSKTDPAGYTLDDCINDATAPKTAEQKAALKKALAEARAATREMPKSSETKANSAQKYVKSWLQNDNKDALQAAFETATWPMMFDLAAMAASWGAIKTFTWLMDTMKMENSSLFAHIDEYDNDLEYYINDKSVKPEKTDEQINNLLQIWKAAGHYQYERGGKKGKKGYVGAGAAATPSGAGAGSQPAKKTDTAAKKISDEAFNALMNAEAKKIKLKKKRGKKKEQKEQQATAAEAQEEQKKEAAAVAAKEQRKQDKKARQQKEKEEKKRKEEQELAREREERERELAERKRIEEESHRKLLAKARRDREKHEREKADRRRAEEQERESREKREQERRERRELLRADAVHKDKEAQQIEKAAAKKEVVAPMAPIIVSSVAPTAPVAPTPQAMEVATVVAPAPVIPSNSLPSFMSERERATLAALQEAGSSMFSDYSWLEPKK